MSKLFRLVLLNIIILEIVTKEESNQVNNSTNPEIIHVRSLFH